MHTVDWQIHPRNADLTRSLDPVSGWESLVLIERYGPPDSWMVSGPPSALAGFTTGMGAILDRNGTQVTSGQVTRIRRESTGTSEKMMISFASDLAVLGGRVVRPSPTVSIGSTIATYPAAYDLRSGAVETLILGFVSSNAGADALVDRRHARLRLPASLGRGGTTQVSGRLDNLGVLVQSLAEAGNLKVRIVHTEASDGAWLDLEIDVISDLSTDIRFGSIESASSGFITDYSYELAAPTATRALVGLGGEGLSREFLELRDSVSEDVWSRVVELFVDQRQIAPDSVDKLAEATRSGQDALAEGKSPVAVMFVPELGPDLEYRRDVQVGDIVGYDLPGLDPANEKIRQATTTVTNAAGQPTERVEIVVGTPDAPLTRDQKQTARALRAINVIQKE